MRLEQFRKRFYTQFVLREWDEYDDYNLIQRVKEGKADVSTIGFISDNKPPSSEYLYPHFYPACLKENNVYKPAKPNIQSKQQEEFEEKERQKQLEKERVAEIEWNEATAKINQALEQKRLKRVALNMLEAAYIRAMLDDDTLY